MWCSPRRASKRWPGIIHQASRHAPARRRRRLAHLYPHPSEAKDAASQELLEEKKTGARRDEKGSEVQQLLGEMAALMAALTPALKRRAADLAAGGKASELVEKLLKGADVMRGSGDMYLSWARHYAALGDEPEETSLLP